MKKKQYLVAGILGAVALFGGATSAALAAGIAPHELPAAVLSGFSSSQQDAIKEAEQIRADANTKAEAVLSDAGVSQTEIRNAMKSFRETQRTAMDKAFTDNNYAAFKQIIANSPKADAVTQDTFTKLVEAYKLDKSGDHDAAMKIRKELGETGFGFGGPGGKGGHHGSPPSESTDN